MKKRSVIDKKYLKVMRDKYGRLWMWRMWRQLKKSRKTIVGDKAFLLSQPTRAGGEPIAMKWWIRSMDTKQISLCKHCGCMTHTLSDGRCGKCKEDKEENTLTK